MRGLPVDHQSPILPNVIMIVMVIGSVVYK